MGDEIARREKDGAVQLFDELDLASLKIVKQVVDLPNDLEACGNDPLMQHRRFDLQLRAAQGHLDRRIKVDETALRAQQHEDALELLRQRVAIAEKTLPPEKK